MEERLIVTRHAGMVEWLRRRGIVGEVLAHVESAEVVAERDVVGMLPYNLAAATRSITIVSMPDLTLEQRRNMGELSPEEMDGAGARLERFVVHQVEMDEPAGTVEWVWDDQMGNRGRMPFCLVIGPDGWMNRFEGCDIEGVVRVLGTDFVKAGKWSYTTYRCVSPAGTVVMRLREDWENGEVWMEDSWEAVYRRVWELAPHALKDRVQGVIRAHWPETAARLDENERWVRKGD